MPCRRPAARKLAMARQRDDEERNDVGRDRQQDVVEPAVHQHSHQADDEGRLDHHHVAMGQERLRLEHDHEGQKVERERDHPQERRGRHIGRDMRRDGDQEAGRNGGKRNPSCRIAPARRRIGPRRGALARHSLDGRIGAPRRRGLDIGQRIARAHEQHAASGDQHDQREEAGRPHARLVAEPGERLDQERIGDERKEAPDVARRVEEIWVAGGRMAGAREPCLQQRTVGGQREERQSDRDREQPEQPQRLALRGRPAPAASDRQRQRKGRDDHERHMDDDRQAARQMTGQEVRIGIAGEQRGLEEHHGHRPHLRRAAEARQHHLGEQRLHRKQQGGREEDRSRVGAQQEAVRLRKGPCVPG